MQPILLLIATNKIGTTSNITFSHACPNKLPYTNLQLCQASQSLLPIRIRLSKHPQKWVRLAHSLRIRLAHHTTIGQISNSSHLQTPVLPAVIWTVRTVQ